MINREKLFGPGALWRYRYGSRVNGEYYRTTRVRSDRHVGQRSIEFYHVGMDFNKDPGPPKSAQHVYSVGELIHEMGLVMDKAENKIFNLRVKILNSLKAGLSLDVLREMLVELEI
jgi:hypothetical protein